MPSRSLPFDALVFDLGNVIVPHDNAALRARIAAGCRRPGSLEAIERRLHGADYTTGALPIAHLHGALRAECGYDGDWERFRADWCSHLALDRAMLDLATRLAETHRVVIFSNTNREHWEHLLALSDGALGAFEAYLSHEMGQMKPDVAAFHAVARDAGIAPERALFVDDMPANIEGARAAGFQAVLFTGRAAFEAFLSPLYGL